MLINPSELIKAIRQEPWASELCADEAFWPLLIEWIEEYVLADFLDRVTSRVDEIV